MWSGTRWDEQISPSGFNTILFGQDDQHFLTPWVLTKCFLTAPTKICWPLSPNIFIWSWIFCLSLKEEICFLVVESYVLCIISSISQQLYLLAPKAGTKSNTENLPKPTNNLAQFRPNFTYVYKVYSLQRMKELASDFSLGNLAICDVYKHSEGIE